VLSNIVCVGRLNVNLSSLIICLIARVATQLEACSLCRPVKRQGIMYHSPTRQVKPNAKLNFPF
jgi:hypothetical protein